MRKIKDVPRKYVQHLHPSLRSIVERPTRRWRVRRPECLRIRNRILYYHPHARIFPWFCETCTLSSRFLSVIQNHSCPNKNLSRHVQDFTNEQRIALLGFRSKAKDALAVMERVPNPQAVDLGRVRFPTEDGDCSYAYNIVPRLSELCLSALSFRSNAVVVSKCVQKNFRPPLSEQSTSRYRPTMRTGQLCTVCHILFPTFREYEEHLETESCPNDVTPNPVPIQMWDCGTIPLNYVYHPKNAHATRSRLMICSLCHNDQFSTSQQFHEHILNCANKLAVL
ncbi:hypothetical protein RB195_018276 [Necator americanus]